MWLAGSDARRLSPWMLLLRLVPLLLAAASAGRLRAEKKHRAGADVYYAQELLDKLRVSIETHRVAMEQRHDLERDRLTAAGSAAMQPADKMLIQGAAQWNEQSRMETEAANTAMLRFYHTIKTGLGAVSTAKSCEYLSCGENAGCRMRFGRAECKCNRCFKGDGFSCKASVCMSEQFFPAMQLAEETARGFEELQVTAFAGDRLAVVYRSSGDGDKGFLMIGKAGDKELVKWGTPQGFSGNEKAFGPVVAALATGRLAVAYRDRDRGGGGFLVSAVPSASQVQDLQVQFDAPQLFAREQSQRMVLIPMAMGRVVCLYAGRTIVATAGAGEAFGGALLVQILKTGAHTILGKYRFAEMAVARLAATGFSPTSLVVGYRALPAKDAPANTPSMELSAVWMEMVDGKLAIDPHPFTLETDKKGMWARDLALVSKDHFSYSYYSSGEKLTKMIILKVDPQTHHMSIAGGPKIIGEGESSWVRAVSVASGAMVPHTFTYMQATEYRSFAETCRVSAVGGVSDCQKLSWADHNVSSASAARLSDGRLMFIFSDSRGAPYYQFFVAQTAMGRQ